MRITNVKVLRVLVCSCILLPILYIIFTWNDAPSKAKDFYNSRISYSARRAKEMPKLVEGMYD